MEQKILLLSCLVVGGLFLNGCVAPLVAMNSEQKKDAMSWRVTEFNNGQNLFKDKYKKSNVNIYRSNANDQHTQCESLINELRDKYNKEFNTKSCAPRSQLLTIEEVWHQLLRPNKGTLTSYANRLALNKIVTEHPEIRAQLQTDVTKMTEEICDPSAQEMKNYWAKKGVNIQSVRAINFNKILEFLFQGETDKIEKYKNLASDETKCTEAIRTFCQGSDVDDALKERLQKMMLADIHRSARLRECAVLLLAFQESPKTDIASYLTVPDENARTARISFKSGQESQTNGRSIFLHDPELAQLFPVQVAHLRQLDSIQQGNIPWAELPPSMAIWHEFNHIKNEPIDSLVAGSHLFESNDGTDDMYKTMLVEMTNVGDYEQKLLESIFEYKLTTKGQKDMEELDIDPSSEELLKTWQRCRQSEMNRQNTLNYKDIMTIFGVAFIFHETNDDGVTLILDPYSEMALALQLNEPFRLSHTGVTLERSKLNKLKSEISVFNNFLVSSVNEDFLNLYSKCLGMAGQEHPGQVPLTHGTIFWYDLGRETIREDSPNAS